MITRVRAEALLKLAEALEACGQEGVTLGCDHHGAVIYYGDVRADRPEITAMQIRLILSRLVPPASQAVS